MAEGEGHILFAKEEKKLIDVFARNRSQCGALLARIYVTAEAWARQKGVALKDVEIVDAEMSPSCKQYSFRFAKKEVLEKNTQTNTDKELYSVAKEYGLFGPDGKRI